MQNHTATLKNSWQFSITICSLYRMLLTNYQRIGNLSPHKNLYNDVHRSFILDRPILETTQMFINGRMDKPIMVISIHSVLLTQQ